MAVYDSGQMNRMRQDAIRRSQEMHRRAAANTPAADELPINQPVCKPEENERKNNVSSDFLNGILGDIFGGKADSDRLLTAALLLLMMKEGADMKLILALGYILL